MIRFKEVEFTGSIIKSAETNGDIYASIKDLCRGMGLDYMTQLTAIRTAGWKVHVFEDPPGIRINMMEIEDIQKWLDIMNAAIDNQELIETNERGKSFNNVEFND